MRDFPSCFGENAVQVADFSSSNSSTSSTNNGSSTKSAPNLVTCVYQCKFMGKLCLITVTWTKSLMGQSLSIGINDSTNQFVSKFDIKPWLFSKRKGCKNLIVDSCAIDIFWDLCYAKFSTGPEPLQGFYVAVLFNQDLALLLGDLKTEALRKIHSLNAHHNPPSSSSIFIAKREHVFGKKVYFTKGQFSNKGQLHDILIECVLDVDDPCLVIRIDSKVVMKVKHLRWKFRGNHTIVVDGLPVEVFWDVHNWFFGNVMGNAVFMFQTCLSAEKLWASQSISDASDFTWSYSQRFKVSQSQGLAFTLVLYAWKNE